MLVNSQMKKYLDELEQARERAEKQNQNQKRVKARKAKKAKTSRRNVELSSIEPFIFPTFIEWDGCVLLKQKNAPDLPSHFKPGYVYEDRTALEASENHIHINDIFEDIIEPIQLLGIGVNMIEIWAAVLYRQFKGERNFYLVLSYDGEEAVLRFYSVRQDEPPWITVDSLDSYLDGVMVIEV